MKKLALLAACAVIGGANATFVDFEGLGHGVPIPAGYGGLNWSTNSFSLDGTLLPPNSGYNLGRTSGVMVGYSAFAIDFGFTEPGGINFASITLNMTAAWRTGVSVAWSLIDGGFGGTVNLSGTWFPLQSAPILFGGVVPVAADTLLLVPSGGTVVPGVGGDGAHIVIDDITYTLVPEPGTMAALGIGALALLRRRRK